jgi:hypothetical protein
MFMIAWLFGTRALWHEAFTSVVITTSLMMLWWAEPGWITHLPTALYLARQSPAERAAFHSAEYAMASETALARDVELGPGDLTAYTDSCMFPGLLWNEAFSNKLEFFPPGARDPEELVDRLENRGAKWVAVGSGSAEWQTLKSRSNKWQEVGVSSTTGPPGIAFRRRPLQPGS